MSILAACLSGMAAILLIESVIPPPSRALSFGAAIVAIIIIVLDWAAQ